MDFRKVLVVCIPVDDAELVFIEEASVCTFLS